MELRYFRFANFAACCLCTRKRLQTWSGSKVTFYWNRGDLEICFMKFKRALEIHYLLLCLSNAFFFPFYNLSYILFHLERDLNFLLRAKVFQAHRIVKISSSSSKVTLEAIWGKLDSLFYIITSPRGLSGSFAGLIWNSKHKFNFSTVKSKWRCIRYD